MQELVNGVPTLTNGVSALKNGTQELVSGSTRLYSGLQNLHTGMNQAKKGTAKLNKATDGLGTLVSGVDEINTNMQALAKGLQDGSNELNASLSDEMLKKFNRWFRKCICFTGSNEFERISNMWRRLPLIWRLHSQAQMLITQQENWEKLQNI